MQKFHTLTHYLKIELDAGVRVSVFIFSLIREATYINRKYYRA